MCETAINVATCPRCSGTGKYSFNLMDLDRCYGCGGTGKVLIKPKGQPRIKPTATGWETAGVGDIVEEGKVLYRVTGAWWHRSDSPKVPHNRALQYTRLVDKMDLVRLVIVRDQDGKIIPVTPEMHHQPIATAGAGANGNL